MVKNKKVNEMKWKKWVIATCCFLPLLTLIFASSDAKFSLLSFNNLTNTNNDMISKSARVANSETLTNSLSDVKPLTNDSRKFKEIYIAKAIDSQEKLFSLVYENDNLYFRTSQDNDLLHSARLSKNKGIDINNNNAVSFGSNVLSIDKITIDEKGQASSKKTVIDTNDENLLESPTFLLSDAGNYFAAGDNHNMSLDFTSKDTFLVRFYLDKLLSTNTLSLFYDDGVNVIGSNSDEQLKSSINMLSSNSSIAIEGYISKTANGVSFSFGQVQSVISSPILNTAQGTVNDRIFESFKNERVSEVLKKVTLGDPNDVEDGTLTWTNYFKPLRLNGFSDSQIIFSSFQITAEPAQGKISITLSIPIMNWISTPTIGMKHFVYVNDNDKQQFDITGFNTGSVLLKNVFDSPIKKIPELALIDSENLLKQIIFEQGFGSDNLLDNFNFATDMNLKYINVDNLKGTINANLFILRNYRDADGNPITGDISKDFGEIQILEFSTISATSQIDEQYTLNANSPFVSVLASEAAKDLDGLKKLIFDNHNSFLDNLPNDITTGRNVTIDDFEIYDAVGNDIRGTINLQIGLKYYFDETLGHYQNSKPFEFNLSILGFDKIKLETTINANPIQKVPQDLKDVLAQNITDLTNLSFRTFLYDAVIEGEKQEISDDNIISIEIESYDNLNGILILSSITLNKWYDANNDIQNSDKKFDAIITIQGFKKSVPTELTGNTFDYKDMLQDILASKISLDSLKQLLDLKYSDMLIVQNLPEGFTPKNIVNPIILTRNDKNGTLEIAFYLDNYYATNGQLITSANKVFGPITITGFTKTDFETKINENPTATDDLKDILAQTVDLNNQIFKKYLFNNVIIDPSKQITIDNIISIKIKPNSINNLLGTLVLDSITLNKWYDDRSVAQETRKEFFSDITISGFKEVVSTAIYKDVIIDGQLSDTLASGVTNEQLKQIIYDQRDIIFDNSNKSLPEIGLDNLFISARNSPRPDALTILFELDSYYDEQGKLITSEKKEFGPITIEGFKKTGFGTHLLQSKENTSIELDIYPYQTTRNPMFEITTKIKQYIFDNVIYSKNGLDVNCISRFSIASSPFDNKNGILLIDSITLNTWVEDNGSINTGSRNFALDNGEQIKIRGFKKVDGETIIKNNLNNPVGVDGELSKLTVSHLIQNANNPLLLEWINLHKSNIFLNLTPNVIITVQKIVENECDSTLGKLVLEVQLSSYFDNDDFYTYKEEIGKTFKISLNNFVPELDLETKIISGEIVLDVPQNFDKTLAQSISEKNSPKEIAVFKTFLIEKIIIGKKELIDIVDFTSTFDNLKGMLILDSITLNHVYDKNGVMTNEKNKLFSNLKINVRGFLEITKTVLLNDKLNVIAAGNFWQDEFAIKLQELITKKDSTIIRSLQELIWNNQSELFGSKGLPLNFSNKDIVEFTTTKITYTDSGYDNLRKGELKIGFKLDTYYNDDGILVTEGKSEEFKITLEKLKMDEKSTNMNFSTPIGLTNYSDKLPYLVSKEEIANLIYLNRFSKQNNNTIAKKIEIEDFEYFADNKEGKIIVKNIKLNSIIDCDGKQNTNDEKGWNFGNQELIFQNLDKAPNFTNNVKEIKVSGELSNYEASFVSNNQIVTWLNDNKIKIFESLPPDSVVEKVEKKDATSEGTSTIEVTLSSVYLDNDFYTYSNSPNDTKLSIILSGFKKENVMQIVPIAIGGAAAVVIAIIVIIVIVYFHRKKKSGKVHVVYEEDL